MKREALKDEETDKVMAEVEEAVAKAKGKKRKSRKKKKNGNSDGEVSMESSRDDQDEATFDPAPETDAAPVATGGNAEEATASLFNAEDPWMKRKQEVKSPRKKPRSVTCSQCGKKGHTKRSCSQSK
jgi:hypothetical protein